MIEFKRPKAAADSPLHTFKVRSTARCIGIVLLLLAAVSYRFSQHDVLANACTAQPADPELLADDATDVHAVDKYKAAVAHMLQQERFDQLDCLADSFRASKDRFAGGMWKLHILYAGLKSPLQHPTTQDWEEHLNRLKHWVSENPDSITARIGLAMSYLNYAWDARGDGTADTVSDNGWQLFGQRAEEARTILQKASTLKAKCPEWYVAMETVALAQGWRREDVRALLEQAIAAEPGYYYVYRMHALYLLPKWHGEEGDTELFAKTIADRVGGEQGDEVYFQIAGFLVCNCNDQPQLNHMSWPRIQKGFAGLDKQYGASLTNLNLLALMAIKLKDAVVADRSFKRIGTQWSESEWRTESYFDSSKTWAAQTAPQMSAQLSLEGEADANLQAAGGPRYQAAFEKKFAGLMHQCVSTPTADEQPFEMLIRVGEGGTVERLVTNPSTAVSTCLFQNLMNFQMTHTAPFPPPPRASYWVRLNLDPAAFSSANSPQVH